MLGGILIVCGCFVRVADPYPVEAARLIYFDYLQRLSPRPFDPDLPVRVVDIDEASLSEIGQWPWPRTVTAQLVERLVGYGAASISFDMLFAEPDRYSPARLSEDPVFSKLLRDGVDVSELDNDERFAQSIAQRPVALGVAARIGDVESNIRPRAGIIEIGENPGLKIPQALHWTPLAAPLDQVAVGIGGVNVSPMGELAVVRTVPLLWRGPTGVLPSLSIEALRLALGEQNIFVEGAQEESGVILSISLGPFTVPTTETGHLWLRYRHDDPALYLSATEVLRDPDDEWLRSQIEGRIILVGTSAAGLLDIRETPLGKSVPGVSIHAQVIEQVIQGKMLQRSDNTAALELIAYVALGMVVTSLMSISGSVISFLVGGLAASFVLGLSWFAFQTGLILFDATFPMIGGIVNFGILAGYLFIAAESDKRVIKRSFAHYVAPEILDQMEESGQEFQLGGETQDITVMFADIRGFTSLSETMPALDMVALLNELFTSLGEEILAEQGTIDKFIGDSVMAFWNAPMQMEEHPKLSAKAALRMRSALALFNDTRKDSSLPPIEFAIGCATGRACVGNIGSQNRFNYTVIGDVVNVAARIEAMCRHVSYDILVSQSVAASSESELALLEAGTVQLKGKSSAETIFLVVGNEEVGQSPAFLELKQSHSELLELLQNRAPNRDVDLAVKICQRRAIGIDPGLMAFYDRVLARSEDFSQMAA
ncbi:CHASE2 domain-containing protein [Shimia gijangensis]|uniref:CHASE2 domain-containing protein n=1 Tax=Shimia gijangensis TaxID=1470563 RepID=UPI001FE5B781|nr:adenylate/guanylate cyclase domain-containing protein [Shimia gijangensis]